MNFLNFWNDFDECFSRLVRFVTVVKLDCIVITKDLIENILVTMKLPLE